MTVRSSTRGLPGLPRGRCGGLNHGFGKAAERVPAPLLNSSKRSEAWGTFSRPRLRSFEAQACHKRQVRPVGSNDSVRGTAAYDRRSPRTH
jgi:hypothetical protein